MGKNKLNKYDKYKELRKSIKILKKREAIEDFKDVNKCIEEILEKSKNGATEEIKSLICQFEGNLNQANFYAIMAVAYAVFISGFSILSDMISSFIDPNDYVFLNINLSMFIPLFHFIAIVGLVIGCMALKTNVRDYQNTFILRVLNFKLDELNKKSESSVKTSTINEKGTKNEAKTMDNPNETKKNEKYTPYNFDEEIEYKIYKNIRERYKRKFLDKKTKVHKEYPDFDKYSEWKTYFESKFLNRFSNKCDFKHYLNDRLRVYQGLVDIGKSVVTPIYIAAITLVLTILTTNGFSMRELLFSSLVGIIIVMIILMCLVWVYGRKVNFFEDCINIIDSEESCSQ